MVDFSELKWAHKVSKFQFVEVELDVAIRFATAPQEERPLIWRPVNGHLSLRIRCAKMELELLGYERADDQPGEARHSYQAG